MRCQTCKLVVCVSCDKHNHTHSLHERILHHNMKIQVLQPMQFADGNGQIGVRGILQTTAAK